MFLEACHHHPTLSPILFHVFIQDQNDNLEGRLSKFSYMNPDTLLNTMSEMGVTDGPKYSYTYRVNVKFCTFIQRSKRPEING